MEFELTSDQKLFVETTRSYLDDSCSTSALRGLRDDPAGFGSGFWTQGAELGWAACLVSEEDGGGSVSGRGVVDLSLVAYEFGRFAAPGPLVGCNVVAGALSAWGSPEQKSAWLEGVLGGEVIGGWAHAEPHPNDRFGAVTVTAIRAGDGWVLNGVKSPVESGVQAGVFLVSAVDESGAVSQFLVPADATGVGVSGLKTVDLTRRLAKVTFTDVTVADSAVLGGAGQARAQIATQEQWALVVQAAEVVGSMDRALEITLEWLFNRYSFGRPLASYQELKHRFVDMRAWLEAGNAIADAAAREVQDHTDAAPEYVSAAKSFLGQYGPEVVQDCVQMHGGIGVTFEHDLHLFLRRVVLNSGLYGTVTDHRERLTTILEHRESATTPELTHA